MGHDSIRILRHVGHDCVRLFTENLKLGAEHLKSLKSLDAVVEISDGLKNL